MHIRIFVVLLLTFITLSVTLSCSHFESSKSAAIDANDAPAVRQNRAFAGDQHWRPANFKGIIIGKSIRLDAIKVLGEPGSSGIESINDMPVNALEKDMPIMDTYERVEFYDSITVESDQVTGVITSITAYPKGLKTWKVIEHFGENYRRSRYDFLECPGDAGGSYITPAPNGQLKYIEYPEQGIAIGLDDSETKVEFIEFTTKPIGVSPDKCG